MATNNISQTLQELYFDAYSEINEHIIDVIERFQEWDCEIPIMNLKTHNSESEYLHAQAEAETYRVLIIKHVEQQVRDY